VTPLLFLGRLLISVQFTSKWSIHIIKDILAGPAILSSFSLYSAPKLFNILGVFKAAPHSSDTIHIFQFFSLQEHAMHVFSFKFQAFIAHSAGDSHFLDQGSARLRIWKGWLLSSKVTCGCCLLRLLPLVKGTSMAYSHGGRT
jgi:hypothetical protein